MAQSGMQFRETVIADAVADGAVVRNADLDEGMSAHGTYIVQCFDADGNLKWEDQIDNVVTTVGKNELLNQGFAGSAYTAAWYLGLISSTSYTTGPAVGDTAASHVGWAEDQNYSASTRPAPAWNSASAGAKATTATSFAINGTTTIKGCFVASSNVKGGAGGVLYSAGLFTGGDKVVGNGDSLSVTYTTTLT